VRVTGNVQGENAASVVLRNSRVGGSVQIVQGKSARVMSSIVWDDILLDEQRR
jgi:hypothetical protein